MRVLITGGAGFVGSSLAINFKTQYPNAQVTAFDNLRRRGSELNLERFKKHGIRFVHGDIRSPHDFDELRSQTYDLFVEASAEPSVLAGLGGSPNYLLETNLFGSFHCFELARKTCGFTEFLSTSRVYSLDPLRQLAYTSGKSRFELSNSQTVLGCSAQGITEAFPVNTARSLYGMTKLASEYLFQEYCNSYGLRGCINRCGVIVGAGQFGKVDQGVFTMWMANHVYGVPLKYIGFDGTGRQVRDLMHPDDLFRAIRIQFENADRISGETFNLGGGLKVSTSLLELTGICQELTGRSVEISRTPTTSPVDIPIYISDCTKFSKDYGWQPEMDTRAIMADINQWLSANKETLRAIFAS